MKKDHFRYLNQRIMTFAVTVFLAGAVLMLAAGQAPVLSGRERTAVVLCLFAMLSVWGYFWIVRPYMQLRSQIQRFTDGYISLRDLNDVEVNLTPEYEKMLEYLTKIVESTRTLDLSKRQAQYRALQNQINPHFLYNTLEGIRSEAMIAGLDNLADMTEALAIFFRYTISKVENLVTVEEELENCRTYFKIQQYRFGSRVHLKITLDEEDKEEILRCRIPKLTLQPILENSIIHGIELKMGEGTVEINISMSGSRLLVKVSDDGVGMDRETLQKLNARLGSKEEEVRSYTREEKGGLALTNVNNRIHLTFGEEYGMHVYSAENVGTSVELTIPIVTKAETFAAKELK